jgi:uncharacterized membrane protein YeiB
VDNTRRNKAKVVFSAELICQPIKKRMTRMLVSEQVGPAEWLWRSLTYLKLQPLLR